MTIPEPRQDDATVARVAAALDDRLKQYALDREVMVAEDLARVAISAMEPPLLPGDIVIIDRRR